MKTILLITVLTCALLWVVNPHPNDVIDPYIAAQQARAGINPYSTEATAAIQQAYYGRPAHVDEDQMRFAFPGYSLLVFIPLSIVPERAALVVWEGAQLALVLLALRRLGVKPLHAALILVALKEPVVNLFVGNTALWVTAWVGFGLAALERQQSKRAALYFAFAALQPVIAVPLALLMLANHRRALVSYGAALAAIGAASVMLWGLWIPDWLAQMRAYTGYVRYLVWLPALFPPVVLVSLAALWRGVLNDNGGRYGLVLSGLVTALPLTGLYHLALFALVRLPVWAWGLIAAVMWGLSPLPFEIRRFEPLALAVIVIASQWGSSRVLIREPQPA